MRSARFTSLHHSWLMRCVGDQRQLRCVTKFIRCAQPNVIPEHEQIASRRNPRDHDSWFEVKLRCHGQGAACMISAADNCPEAVSVVVEPSPPAGPGSRAGETGMRPIAGAIPVGGIAIYARKVGGVWWTRIHAKPRKLVGKVDILLNPGRREITKPLFSLSVNIWHESCFQSWQGRPMRSKGN